MFAAMAKGTEQFLYNPPWDTETCAECPTLEKEKKSCHIYPCEDSYKTFPTFKKYLLGFLCEVVVSDWLDTVH